MCAVIYLTIDEENVYVCVVPRTETQGLTKTDFAAAEQIDWLQQ